MDPSQNLIGRIRFLIVGYDRVVPVTHVDQTTFSKGIPQGPRFLKHSRFLRPSWLVSSYPSPQRAFNLRLKSGSSKYVIGLTHTVVDIGRGTAEGCFVQYSHQVALYLEASFN